MHLFLEKQFVLVCVNAFCCLGELEGDFRPQGKPGQLSWGGFGPPPTCLLRSQRGPWSAQGLGAVQPAVLTAATSADN